MTLYKLYDVKTRIKHKAKYQNFAAEPILLFQSTNKYCCLLFRLVSYPIDLEIIILRVYTCLDLYKSNFIYLFLSIY